MTRMAIFLAGLLLVAPASAADLQGHRANFNLSLLAAGPAAQGVLGVIGRMGVEFDVVCDGYVTRYAMQMLVRDAMAATIESRYTATLWERTDGREMTFETMASFGNQSDSPYAGKGVMGEGSAGGRVAYDEPGGTLPLHPGTVYPSEHTRALLDAAANGERLLTQDVFEGGAPLNYTTVNSSIGEVLPADSTDPALAGRKSWMVREAHFRPGSRTETPEFEIGFRLYEGGLIDNLDFDYGPFRVGGKLSTVELLPKPRC